MALTSSTPARSDVRNASFPHAEGSKTSHKHMITVCTSCQHKSTDYRQGVELTQQLRAAGGGIASGFAISGVACMVGCSRLCTMADHATRKATYLFGDIASNTGFVASAYQYHALDNGWYFATTRPDKLRCAILARRPAALIVANLDVQQ